MTWFSSRTSPMSSNAVCRPCGYWLVYFALLVIYWPQELTNKTCSTRGINSPVLPAQCVNREHSHQGDSTTRPVIVGSADRVSASPGESRVRRCLARRGKEGTAAAAPNLSRPVGLLVRRSVSVLSIFISSPNAINLRRAERYCDGERPGRDRRRGPAGARRR